jgi:hypothetical protein
VAITTAHGQRLIPDLAITYHHDDGYSLVMCDRDPPRQRQPARTTTSPQQAVVVVVATRANSNTMQEP